MHFPIEPFNILIGSMRGDVPDDVRVLVPLNVSVRTAVPDDAPDALDDAREALDDARALVLIDVFVRTEVPDEVPEALDEVRVLVPLDVFVRFVAGDTVVGDTVAGDTVVGVAGCDNALIE